MMVKIILGAKSREMGNPPVKLYVSSWASIWGGVGSDDMMRSRGADEVR